MTRMTIRLPSRYCSRSCRRRLATPEVADEVATVAQPCPFCRRSGKFLQETCYWENQLHRHIGPNTPFTLMRFKASSDGCLRSTNFVGGRLRLSCGRSRKVYALTAVNAVPSRFSWRYNLRFPAVLCCRGTTPRLAPHKCERDMT